MRKKIAGLVAGITALTLVFAGIGGGFSSHAGSRELVDSTSKTYYQMPEYYNASHLFGAAGSFHLFSNGTINLGVHCNGNFAANIVNGSANSGTNQATNELAYAVTMNNSSNNVSSILAVGTGTTVTDNWGNALKYGPLTNNQILMNRNTFSVGESQKIYKTGAKFIDFDKEFTHLKELSANMARLKESGDTHVLTKGEKNNNSVPGTYNFDDNNNAYIHLKDGVNVVRCTADALNNAGSMNIYGMRCNKSNDVKTHKYAATQALFVNVDCANTVKITPGLETKFHCECADNTAKTNGEDNYYHGTIVVWNFYDSTKTNLLYTGTVEPSKVLNGCYLVPSGSINAGQNTNGTLIAKNITTSGESHRADFKGKNPFTTTAATPTPAPTKAPTPAPTKTTAPTKAPTPVPTKTTAPTKAPTPVPTKTTAPTKAPTPAPTKTTAPTKAPTPAPTKTATPTKAPTPKPTTATTPDISGSSTTKPKDTPKPEKTPDLSGSSTTAPKDTPKPEKTPDLSGSSTTAPKDTPKPEKTPDISGSSTEAPQKTPDNPEKTPVPVQTPSPTNSTSTPDQTVTPGNTTQPGTVVNTPTPTTQVGGPGEQTPQATEKPGSKKKNTGALQVTIVDEKTGDVVPGAKVKVEGPDGKVKTYTSDKDGKISISKTAVGEYEIQVSEVPKGYTVTKNKTKYTEVKKNKTTKEEVRINNGNPGGKSGSSNKKTTVNTSWQPKTGDNFDGRIPAVLLLAALIMSSVAIVVKRKFC